MSRLIDADALFQAMENADWYNNADRDDIAEKLVLDAPTVNHWIPVSEAPPPVGKTVLVTVEADDGDAWTNTDTFYQGSWMRYCGEGRKVTAWCELPEPWKGDIND